MSTPDTKGRWYIKYVIKLDKSIKNLPKFADLRVWGWVGVKISAGINENNLSGVAVKIWAQNIEKRWRNLKNMKLIFFL